MKNNQTKEKLLAEIGRLKKELKKKKKYGLVWNSKREPEEVIEMCKEKLPVLKEVKSKEIITDKNKPINLLIEGDNYHALSVLNYTHKNKINGIYIDPPYNTGSNDWKYNNDYIDSEDPYRHTKWISFMDFRLKIAKNLLTSNGIICCTIDDYELPRLIMIMEDIFGEKNHLGTVCIRNNPSGRSTLKGISINHEYAVFFAKSVNSEVGRLPRNEKQINRYNKKDDKGYYEEVNFRKGGGLREESPIMFYPIFISDKFWRVPKMYWNKEKKEWILQENLKKGEDIIYPVDDLGRDKRWKWGLDRVKNESDELFVRKINRKNHLFHKNRMAHETVLPNTWWDKKEYSATDHGTRLLKEMFGELKTFDYPKAVVAVKDCLSVLSSEKNAVFLDFFAGSGSTGHAVLELNKEDKGKRKFILCTNNENSICQKVTYPRIKKVIDGYKNSKGGKIKGIEGNLKYFKTDFVEYKEATDRNKIRMTEEAIEMLCIKEGTFEEIENRVGFKIFKNHDHYMGIIFDQLKIKEFKKVISDIRGKFSVYVFSLGDDTFDEEFKDIKQKVKLAPIPEAILKVYRRIFK